MRLQSGAEDSSIPCAAYFLSSTVNAYFTTTFRVVPSVTINQDKIADDERLDCLKGHVTNSEIRNEIVVENYRNLSFIERESV